MNTILWIATALVTVHAARGYILLTANIEDVQNLARRLAQSPIGGQVGSIVRRAYSVFNNHLGKARASMRADDKDSEMENRPDFDTDWRRNKEKEAHSKGQEDKESQKENDDSEERKKDQEEFSALGKSASVYLQKIKKIFENPSQI